jgi:NADP-dependent 3-hydroxy acid dehydrogenase YdfG
MATERPLEDEVALITGASSGIGAATAHALARDGADVVLAARREERLSELAEDVERESDREALVVPTDVTDDDAVDALVEATVEEFGRLDAVVANAGLAFDESVEEMSNDAYRTMTGVNVDGMFYTARAAIPHLRESRGNLVFLGSFAGQYPRPANPVYAATKWWTRGFALSLQASLGNDVGVTVVNPAEVRTEFGSESGESSAERFEEGAVTEPEEVADAIGFAVRQRPRNSVTSIDLYRRDKLSQF